MTLYRIAIIVPDEYVQQAREAGVALGFSDMYEYSVRLSGTGGVPPTYHGLSTIGGESFASIIKPSATIGDGLEIPDPSEETLEAILPFAPLLGVMKSRIDHMDFDPPTQFNLLCEENGVTIINEEI